MPGVDKTLGMGYDREDKFIGGGSTMRIAIPFYENMIFQHFGHAPQFKIYELENRQVVMEMIIAPEQSGHAAVAELLKSMDVRVVICGNIGAGAQQALTEAGILFYGGVTGEADGAIAALIEGHLTYDPGIRCEDHGHHCGEEGCGDCGECGHDCSACIGCGD